MALVIKTSVASGKDVLVLRYDEARILEDIFSNISIRQLRSRFVLGVHIGTRMQRVELIDFIDFYMYPQGGVTWKDREPDKWLDLTTRNFVDASLRLGSAEGKERDIDFLFISNLSSVKNCDLWIRSLDSFKELNRSIRTVSIMPISEDEVSEYRLVQECLDRSQNLDNQKDSVLLLKRTSVGSLYPVSSEEIAKLMSRTKVFCHLSSHEGECRVITEALLNGCWVVAWKDLEGAALSAMEESNSVLYDVQVTDSVTGALGRAIEKARIGRSKTSNPEEFQKEVSIIRMAERLSSWFPTLNREELVLSLKTVNLRLGLAGHLTMGEALGQSGMKDFKKIAILLSRSDIQSLLEILGIQGEVSTKKLLALYGRKIRSLLLYNRWVTRVRHWLRT